MCCRDSSLLVALAKDLILVPRILFQVVHNYLKSRFMGSNVLFWLPQAPTSMCTYHSLPKTYT